MSAKFSDLIAYFEGLATRHKSIGHSETEKHFCRMETDEALGAMNRQDVEFPLLALEGFRYGFTDNRADNLMKNREGGFMLLQRIKDVSDFATMHQLWDELEEIGDDILIKMRADKRNPLTPVIRDLDFNSIEALLIRNEIGYTIGSRYLFNISSPASTDVDESKWNEGSM